MKALALLLLAAMPAGAAELRLTAEQAEAARADGEARAVEMFAREDAAAAAKKRRLLTGLDVRFGAGGLADAHAPLGDIGASDFVYLPNTDGRRRYRD